MAESTNPNAIAIVGLAGRFPGARGLDDFWRNNRDGVESLETFSDADLDASGVPAELRSNPHFVRKGTTLDLAEFFDAGFFGISPREAQILDPQHRIFLECAWEALEHAGYAGGAPHENVGVYAGASMNTYLLACILRDAALVESVGGYQLMLSNDKDFLCTRVSYKLDLHGPSMTIQTACSTSLVAVEMACRALQWGECDLALAGGVSVSFPQRGGYLYQEGMILSPDGHCRPFDADARGIRGGAGAGLVVLKRLADALADRDSIHAVILGAAVNNDGSGKAGYTAPSVDGQIEVIAMAQTLAGVDPRSISYVETHGTGTPLGDPIEIAALTQVFRASTPDVGFCRIGSLKANIGHLDAAAGVAGLIKTILALKHREIPPLVNFRTPNPQLNLEQSPFVASAQGSIWVSDTTPRRAGVSSFGIGGTNAHVVLEEAPPVEAASEPQRDAYLLVLSARTATAMEQATANLASHLEASPELSLADVEWTLQIGRMAFPHRRAVAVRDTVQAVAALRQPQRPPVLTGLHEGGTRPVAFLFSGQGSQHVGMGAGLFRSERVFRAAVDRCASLLQPHLGLDIREVIFGAPDDAAINETRLTQPALFVTEYALASLWMRWGVVPRAMMGHSIGEYVAAHLAGVMSLEDALAVVAARGRLMQALPAGSMAAVHLGEGELGRRLNAGVEIAAVNAPGLCTVSGPTGAVSALLARLEADGIESRALHTSHAFHSAMMEPALASFTDLLKGIVLAPPTIPYVSNVTGTWMTPEQATSPDYYATHLRRTVRFEAGVRTLAADPSLFFVEIGPGNALTSLARMAVGKDGARRVIPSLSHPREGRPDVEAVLEAAGRLWIAGAPVDWPGVHDGEAAGRIPLPTYPFERKRHWVEPSAAPLVAGGAQPEDAGRPRRSSNVDDSLYAPTWTRDDSCIGRSSSPRGQWLVLGSAGPLSNAVMGRLKDAGAVPVLVEPGESFQRLGDSRFAVRPGNSGDIAAVVRDLRGATGQVDGAFFLWVAEGAKASRGNPVELSYHGLVALAAGLDVSPSGAAIRIIVATDGAESVLDEPVRHPEAALALGPVLALPVEMPGLDTRAVDLALDGDGAAVETAALTLVEESAIDDGERLVARRAGRRWVRRFEPLALPPADAASLPLKTNGVYLITGGTGGIGLTLARWLAVQVSARLVLTARTAFPARGEWNEWLAEHEPDDRIAATVRAIQEIEGLGGEVVVAAADSADPVAMQRVIEDTRTRWGAIDGVIHGAGVPGTGVIALRKQPDDVRSVIAPKLDGLAVLVRLLGDAPLDFVALLSSINSFFGVPGVSDYGGANAVLDAFVDSTARPPAWRQVVTFDWGPWRDVGMSANLVVPKDQRAERDAFLALAIPPTVGAEAFARVLASKRRRVAVVPSGLMRTIEAVRTESKDVPAASEQVLAAAPTSIAAAQSPASPASAASRPDVSSTFAPPETVVERRVAAIWTELLGIDGIGVHDDFFELGGHSLMATRVLARIDAAFGVRLALRDVFDAPTIHRLSERIAAALPRSTDTGQSPDDDREEIDI